MYFDADGLADFYDANPASLAAMGARSPEVLVESVARVLRAIFQVQVPVVPPLALDLHDAAASGSVSGSIHSASASAAASLSSSSSSSGMQRHSLRRMLLSADNDDAGAEVVSAAVEAAEAAGGLSARRTVVNVYRHEASRVVLRTPNGCKYKYRVSTSSEPIKLAGPVRSAGLVVVADGTRYPDTRTTYACQAKVMCTCVCVR